MASSQTKITFLDVEVQVMDGDELKSALYRKPSAAQLYIALQEISPQAIN